ncbi:MAG: ABC transporter ATP-binding protein [Myxococcota bacterium]
MSAPAIEVRGLTRRFGDVTAVDHLSLTVTGPGVFGFLGANGAGKTTAIRMLVGLIHPTQGEILLFGEPAEKGGTDLRSKMGYLPQDPAFYPWMTGEEYLRHAADLFGLDRKDGRGRIGELLEISGLSQAARRRVGGYSGGMKQRLGIAQALINDPELILLDEPVSALDPVGRAEVLELVRTLGEKATVFMSSHILADVERVCEEVAIIDEGKLLIHERTASLRAGAIRPIVTCRVRGRGERLEEMLRDESWVADVRHEPDQEGSNAETLRMTVTDLAEAEQGLPRIIARAGVGLVSLAPVTPSLEEVFIELVGKSAKSEERPS